MYDNNSKQMTTRQLILETATEHFMRDGFKATSTRQIAKEVGITQPNLYHHFASKEALYITALEMIAEIAQKNLQRITISTNYLLEDSLVEMTHYLRKTHSYNFAVMLNDMKIEISQEASLKLYRIFEKAYLQPFIDLFEVNADKIRSDYDSKLLANHFFLVIAPYMNPDNLSYSQLTIETIVNFFLNGITQSK